MKPAREHHTAILDVRNSEGIALIEARDAEIRAEEHEARTALFALERAAHKKELREVQAAALRDAAGVIGRMYGQIDGVAILRDMADRAERGES